MRANSWFERHQPTEFMIQGSTNEEFLKQEFIQQTWVSQAFEVGLLQTKNLDSLWIAVSADAIILGTVGEEKECVIFI